MVVIKMDELVDMEDALEDGVVAQLRDGWDRRFTKTFF